MKKIIFFLLIAVLVVGTVSAQNRNDSRRNNSTVTIDGTLQLEKGAIAVSSGDSVYYVPSLTRYIGFIDGLKEGASVSVEGYEYRNVLYPVKVTIAGKSYDFASDGRSPGGLSMIGPGSGMTRPGLSMTAPGARNNLQRNNSGPGWGNSNSRRNNNSRFGCCG